MPCEAGQAGTWMASEGSNMGECWFEMGLPAC